MITSEDEVLPAGRNGVNVMFRDAELGGGPHVCDFGIPTVSDPGVHHPTTIVRHKVVGQYLGHGVPVAGREVRVDALEYSACRVFQPWCWCG